MRSWQRKPAVLIVTIIAILSLLLAGCGKRTDNNATGGAGSTPSASPSPTASASIEPSPVDPNASHPVVTFEMDSGKIIKAELYPEIAPNTVNNFISLIQKGFYDGLTFHRAVPDFMIQGGDPEGNGTGGPDYAIPGEFTSNGFKNDLKHTRGVLSMARTPDPDSAGSQFFIMVGDTPSLDGDYAAFGKVTEGMDAVDEIANMPTNQQMLVTQPVIKKVTVDTLGVNYSEPMKTGDAVPAQ
ncbi:peptidylprolyl isomerase [Cohnella lubricantis]|uniref:Peptidyl-prolyl cis-trans isomerase n=1 Tax=Cohnella lubricantis TaxID=2163172 RepID=A0A841TL27_9BACL|nr:peptidylprolyl isomerase [Cohnella lubricantis]MBB6679241.1 peptidylprolyl isomerase [Cohnella lubricantis]MBP2119571.1 peptidyl-prolyl cis-trans isomerase B (cyclophilin B) [Cohnella lubricantis]